MVEKTYGWAGMAALLTLTVAPGVVNSAETQATKPGTSAPAISRKMIERGRYMMTVGSCNDCHTTEFAPRDGNVSEKDWLLGSGPLVFADLGARLTRPICA